MTKKKNNRPKHQKDASFGDTSEEEYNAANIQGKSCPHVVRGIHFGRVKKSLKSAQSIITCNGCTTENNDVEQPEVWLCLQCGYKGCGRTSENKHGLQHFKTLHSDCHSLVLSTSSGSVWCYDCDDEISLQTSRILKQCVEFVMKMALNAPQKSTVPNVAKYVSQQSVQSSVIKEEPVVQNTETNNPVEKGKKSVKNSKEIAARISIKGLRNLGNTCFFNAVMQNLNQTSLLYHELKNTCNPSHLWEVPELTITNSEITESENASTFKLSLLRQLPLTNSLLNFLEQMSASSNSKVDIVNPSSLFGEISKKCPQFRHFQQQDSHELLRQLLDGVRQEEIKRQKKAILRHFDLENVNPDEVDDEMKKEIKAYGCYASHTIIEKIFGGLLISTVLCEECKMSSQVFEPFMDLSLPLFEEKQQECNEQLNAMLDGGKQDRIKPLRNKKMEWDSDENAQTEYVLSKPKNDLGKPSKHQEKKQKQLAKKEKKRAKNTARNRKNSLNDVCDNATSSQVPEGNECSNEEENGKEVEEDKEEEEKWELTALLEPEDDNSKSDSESRVAQDPLCLNQENLSDHLAKEENEHPAAVYQTCEYRPHNQTEISDLSVNCANEGVDSGIETHDISLTQDQEDIDQRVGMADNKFDGICIAQNPTKQNDLVVEIENHHEVPEFILQMPSSSPKNNSVSNDFSTEETSILEDTSIKEDSFCNSVLQIQDSDSIKHVESNDLPIDKSLVVENSPIINKDSFSGPETSAVGNKEHIPQLKSQDELEKSEMPVLKLDRLADFETCDSSSVIANEVDTKELTMQNGETEQSFDETSNLDDSLQGLTENFRRQLKICDSPQSNIDDRLHALSMQVKDVRIRRDSDRQENLLNSSESGDDCESLKTNCTSPKSSIEDTCSVDNSENWSHSVSEQQTKDWISKTLTTLKPRHHVSPLECSLNSCLSHFTKPELLTGNNKFRCENCTELKIKKTGNKKDVAYSNASKQLLIFSPPAVLTLHLKRFQQVGMSLRKVNRFVEFPLILDLAPFCCSACTILPHMSAVEDGILYSLYGIVEHSGRLTSGHYTAYVKANKRTINKSFECQLPLSQCDLQQLLHKFSGAAKSFSPDISEQTKESRQWYYISDSHVKEVSEAQVLKCQAYLLFYERIK